MPVDSETNQNFNQYSVSWRELCPWTIIFRALPVACSPTIVILALLGCVLSPAGWLVSEKLFVNSEMKSDGSGFEQELKTNRSTYQSVFPEDPVHYSPVSVFGIELHGVDLVYLHHINPGMQLTGINSGWRRFAYFAVGWAWTILVWSFFATGICRVATMRLTRGETIGLDDAFNYSIWKFPASISGLMLPIAGVCLVALPMALLGFFLKADWGTVVLGAGWIVMLVLGFLVALLLVGLMFAWPLIIASVSTEGQDSFDAMSRTFAYTYRRPVHYLFYTLIALVFGGFVWLVADQFTTGVIHLAHWGASFGANAGADRMDLIQASSIEDLVREGEVSGTLDTGRSFIRFWNGFAKTIGAAFFHGFFWCVATAVYLLLRKDLDQVHLDEVLLVEPYGADELPEMDVDEDDLPSIKEQADNQSESASENDQQD